MSKSANEIRHPTDSDVSWVMQNMEGYLVDPFEAPNVKLLFEMTPWSLVSTIDGDISAYAAFVDYPYQDHWSKDWLASVKDTWESSKYFGINSLFLHLFVCKSDLKQTLEAILRVTFLSVPTLKFCCLLVREPRKMEVGLDCLFRKDDSLGSQGVELWAAERDSYVSSVCVRNKRSEDYTELKNLFSRMYGPFKDEELKNFTLDFLDYGEDRMATYKYFTYDDDNTFVGIAENDAERAVGLVYATIQRVDLESLNRLFQLECVYGLRKRHPDDDPGIDFAGAGMSASDDDSCDEEDDVREVVASLVDEIVTDFEVVACMKDLMDDVSDAQKRRKKRADGSPEVESLHLPTFLNSREFDLKNPAHSLLMTQQNLRYFTPSSLLRIVNSEGFDPASHSHMRLLPRLGRSIREVEPSKLEEIMKSDLFDPGLEEHAVLCVHVMSCLPEEKLRRFHKSTIGNQIYEKLMYRLAEEKQDAISKAKKSKPAPKLSFKEAQILLHHTKGQKQKERMKKGVASNKAGTGTDSWKRISYRNMGFISGLPSRSQYGAQDDSAGAEKEIPSGKDDSKEHSKTDQGGKFPEKYPISSTVSGVRMLQEIPVYNGGTNCLHVEQFAIDRVYESQSPRLIAAAFAYFPRVDYCMVLLPYGTRHVPYLRRYFCNVPPRPLSRCDRELYVLHKTSMNASFAIRPYLADDFDEVRKLVSGSCLKGCLLRDIENCEDNQEKRATVLVTGRRVFGISVIQDLKEVETIRRNFDVADRINMKYHKQSNQGLLLHCVLHPIFKYLSNVFLNEVMKLSGKSIVYYKIYPTRLIRRDPSQWQSLCNFLEQLHPLKPFQKPSKSFIVLAESKKDPASNKAETVPTQNVVEDKYYSLAYTCTKLVMRNININTSRIVVVGDSDLALGVLESLVYGETFKYTNLTVVTRHGLRGEFNLDDKCFQFLPMSMNYTKFTLDGMCLPVWVSVVRGEVLTIKKSRLVLQEVSDDKQKRFVVRFDYLVICCDLEFQSLGLKTANVDSTSDEPPKPPVTKNLQYPLLKNLVTGRFSVVKSPSNVFAVNTVQEVAVVLNWLWRFFSNKVESRKQTKKKYKSLAEKERDKKEGRIVLYGNILEAYSALAAIIDEDFPLSRITFVKPETGARPFHTEIIEDAVVNIIGKTEVDLVLDASIEYDASVEEVVNIKVTTKGGTRSMDCCALLLFNEKKINYNTFMTMHVSPLSFALPLTKSKDVPYLLVKRNFLTNMKNVFVAGTASAMHAGDGEMTRLKDHVYNERELGMVVGKILDDLVSGSLHSSSLPVLSRPKVTHALLPGGYRYILITAPSSLFKSASDKATENAVKRLVLGNLNLGDDVVPDSTPRKAEDGEESENPDENYDEPSNPDQSREPTANALDESCGSAQNSNKDSVDPGEKETGSTISDKAMQDKNKEPQDKPLLENPEIFALTFDKRENISAIECLTDKPIDAVILKNLYELHVSQLYKVIQTVCDKGAPKVSFRLTEDWIMPLDYVMFEDENAEGAGVGYEGYWRQGYPKHIEGRLNSFLDSFVDRKKK